MLHRLTLCLTSLVLSLVAFSSITRAQLDGTEVIPDVVYGHKDGLALTFDVFRPKEKSNGTGLLFMVSGGWVSTWTEPAQIVPMFRHLLMEGYTVMAVRHGSSPRYVVPECVSDVQLALSYIASHAVELKVDPSRLGVFGYSAGGHLSLMLGTVGGTKKGNESVARVAAVVAVFPPTELGPYVDPKNPIREQFPALKFDPARADAFSPLKQVSSEDAPTLLVHGDKDELVPLWHSEKIKEAFDQAQVDSKLVVIKGAAHGFDGEGNKRLASEMLEWFDKHLKTTNP